MNDNKVDAKKSKKSRFSFGSGGLAAAPKDTVMEESANVKPPALTRPVTVGPTVGLNGEQGKEKGQAVYIELPISKKKILCSHAYLDPNLCFASPLNKRIQSLLTQDNVEVMKLCDSIKAEGQRDPVLARPVTIDGELRYEVIYGTRRRYAAALLANTFNVPIKLRAWLSAEISDVDAKRLANSENDDRVGISAWETAQYIHSQLRTKKPAVVADEMGMSEASIYKYDALAALPELVVAVFEAPSVVSVTSGSQIARLIKNSSEEQLLTALHSFAGAKATTTAEFLKALKAQKSPAQIKIPAREKLEWKSKTGTARFSIARNQKMKDAFTAKLEGVSDASLVKIMEAIKHVLG